MKQHLLRILFFVAILIATNKTQAQYVTIPDTNFVIWLYSNGYAGCMNGNMMDTTCGAVVNATVVSCMNENISDLSGIEFFDNLNILWCQNNQLSSLPNLPNTVKNLDCSNNLIVSLPSLPDSLFQFSCYNNLLISMPSLPNSLSIFDCSKNSISILPSLPVSLGYLFCVSNQLTTLPSLPNSLVSLDCSKNQLTSLPTLPNTLTGLSCEDNSLTNLPALSTTLTHLFCDRNQLTFLPTLSNTLTSIYCRKNLITSLPTLPDSLKTLVCDSNQLSSLPTLPSSLTQLSCNVTQLTSIPSLPSTLIELHCAYNQLTSLPVLSSSLIWLYCNQNQLTNMPALPISLTNFDCGNNQLTSIPTLPISLQSFICKNNQITTLPALPITINYIDCSTNLISSLPALPANLRYLFCDSNQLSSLPILPDTLTQLRCQKNSNLKCLPKLTRIWALYFSNTGIQCLPNYGDVHYSSPSLTSLPLCDLFNTNGCEAYWNISGHVYSDSNSNCISNSNEPRYSNIKLNLSQSGNLQQTTYNIGNGNYSFDTDTGLYSIEVDTLNKPFTVNCPSTFSDTAYLANADTMRSSKNFALACKPGFDIGVSTVILDSGIFRPANFANIKILAGDISNHYGLHCAAGTSGVVQVIINGPATYIGTVNGAITPTVNGNTLTYTIPDFGLIDFDNDFQIQVQTDTLAQLGQQVCFDVIVTPTMGDNNITNNTLTQCFTVVNSYDPNDKAVSPSGVLSLNDKKLTYTIRFQNTGNAPAQHIYLMDTLDANLDVSTFELLAFSHQPQVQLIGNNLRFNFPNINLPDSTNDEPNSHGYVQYSIKLKDSLPFGTIIKNTAYIYFDFNPPVVTNTTSNVIVSSIFDYETSQNNITVYPNPTTNTITIATNILSNNCTAKLFDMLGKELQSQKLISNHTQINLQGLSGGNYLLKVMNGDVLVGVKRVVKM